MERGENDAALQCSLFNEVIGGAGVIFRLKAGWREVRGDRECVRSGGLLDGFGAQLFGRAGRKMLYKFRDCSDWERR
jgi:hypothetical protein